MYSNGLPHMAEQKVDCQLEHTYSSSVRIRDVALRTCQRRWTIGWSGERGSGISVLATWHDDDIYIFGSYIYIFTNPSARAGYDTRSICFKRSLTGLNSEFSFSLTSCLTKAQEPSLSYYLPIAIGRIIGFIPFPKELVLCEMQSVSSRIWTRVAVSISYDDSHHTTGTFGSYI